MVEKYKGTKSYELAVNCLQSGNKKVREVFKIWVKDASAIDLLKGIEYSVQEGILKRHEIINLMELILEDRLIEDGVEKEYICAKCEFKHLKEPVPFICENGIILCDECKPTELILEDKLIEDEEEKTYKVYYQCYKCGNVWDEIWDSPCDSECGLCGVRDVTAKHFEEVGNC